MIPDLAVWFREQLEAHAGDTLRRDARCRCGWRATEPTWPTALASHAAHVGDVLAAGLEQLRSDMDAWDWFDDVWTSADDGAPIPVFRFVVLPHPKETRSDA